MKRPEPYTARPFSEAAVSEFLTGGKPYLAPADRQEAIRRLLVRGALTVPEIAAAVGVTTRTVYRVIQRTNTPAPARPARDPIAVAAARPSKIPPSLEVIAARRHAKDLAKRLANVDPYRSPTNHARLTGELVAARTEIARLTGEPA